MSVEGVCNPVCVELRKMRMVYVRVVQKGPWEQQQGYATLWVEVEKMRTTYESPK